MKLITIYLTTINATAFLLMLTDKQRAKKNLWRIPEVSLFAAALMGGSLGAITGMYCFRHKTHHLKFLIGLPCLLLINIITIYVLRQFL